MANISNSSDARPTKEDLIAKGWTKATPDEVEAFMRGVTANSEWSAAAAGEWRYSQPCESGGMTCYLDANGRCTDCYRDPAC